MGNQQSKNGDSNTLKMNLLDTLDVIASDIILTSEFNHLKNAFDDEHCNKLIVMTTRVLKKKFNMKQLVDIDKRIVKGNNMKKNNNDNDNNDTHVVYTTPDAIQDLDTKNDTKKYKLCKRIAAFYCRIFMLYDAILKTINPVYIYRDYTTLQIKPYLRKNEIPERYIDNAKLWSNSFCMKRLYRFIIEYNDYMNINKNDSGSGEKNKTKALKRLMNVGLKCSSDINEDTRLVDEQGIPELKSLYYDMFNFDTNMYDYMSQESRIQYNEDLSLFYKVFTGKNKPDDIVHFKDIPLYDYCKTESDGHEKETTTTKIYETTSDHAQFSEYAKSLISYIQETKRYENKLMDILKIMFIKNEQGQYGIHPDLNIYILENIITQTRHLITNMYVSCESNFKKILGILNVIASERIYINELQKKNNLVMQKERLMTKQ